MKSPDAGAGRDRTRAQLVKVAAELLASQGPGAVTTRSVALAAGMQAPAIYRIFGDKSALLDAVVQHGFETYMARNHVDDTGLDPVESLRRGWELHIGFGLANPELFRLMHAAPRTPDGPGALPDAGVLAARVHRIAEAGRLRVPERRAVGLVSAAGTGVVFTLIGQPGDTRDESLADAAWEAVSAAILADEASAAAGPAAAAVTLRSALPGFAAFTAAERGLLAEWLERITGSGG